MTPVFASLTTSFRCHIQRRQPAVIYRVSFYVTLPGLRGLESPILDEQLLSTGTSTENVNLHRNGRKLFGMLTVEHDVGGPPLDNDLLLTGSLPEITPEDDDSNIDDNSGTEMNYTAQPASTERRNAHIKDSEFIDLYSPGQCLHCR